MGEPTFSLRALRELEGFGESFGGNWIKITPTERDALVGAVEALREMHEEECGCRDPGNWDVCENIAFRVLARFTEEGT